MNKPQFVPFGKKPTLPVGPVDISKIPVDKFKIPANPITPKLSRQSSINSDTSGATSGESSQSEYESSDSDFSQSEGEDDGDEDDFSQRDNGEGNIIVDKMDYPDDNDTTLPLSKTILVGGYTITIDELLHDMINRIHQLREIPISEIIGSNYGYVIEMMKKSLGVGHTYTTLQDLTEIYIMHKSTIPGISDNDIYDAYLSFIYNIPMIFDKDKKILINETDITPYTIQGDEIEKYIDEINNTIEGGIIRDDMEMKEQPEITSLKRQRTNSDASGDDLYVNTKNVKTHDGGAVKYKTITKKDYTNKVKPWLDSLKVTGESGELFQSYLTQTRDILGIHAKKFSKQPEDVSNIVTVLRNMMNLIQTVYKIKPPYTPPISDTITAIGSESAVMVTEAVVAGMDTELDTITLLDDCVDILDGDLTTSKIIIDMMSIFMCLVLYCIANKEPTIDNFMVEMRTLYSSKFGSTVDTSIKRYRGKEVLFLGCTVDNKSQTLYLEDYFTENGKLFASPIEANGNRIDNQRIFDSSNGNNSFSSPLTGALPALLSYGLDKNKICKLVCYDLDGNDSSNTFIKTTEMENGGVAPRTCIPVGIENISEFLVGIKQVAPNTIIDTIIGSKTQYEFIDILLQYSVTSEMIQSQIQNFRILFDDDFIDMILMLLEKFQIGFADAGVCILHNKAVEHETLEGMTNNIICADFISSTTFVNPDNRSINYKYIYYDLYYQLYNYTGTITPLSFTQIAQLTFTQMKILVTTYVTPTPVSGASGHFHQNWTTTFNNMIASDYRSNFTHASKNIGGMGEKVAEFNSKHGEFLASIETKKESPTYYTVTYSDNSQTYGYISDETSIPFPEFFEWLDSTAIDCSFENFQSYFNNTASDIDPISFCEAKGIFSLRCFIKSLAKDIYHDSKPSATRVNQTNSDAIKEFVNYVLNFQSETPSSDPIKDILTNARLPNNKITPNKGRSYEQQCFGEVIDDNIYLQMTGGGISNAIADQLVSPGNIDVYKYNNAVMKKTNMEDSGNSATFIDGGTLKQTENLIMPNLCLCIHGNQSSNEQGDKFYIIVSYECRHINPGIENIVMRINFIYIPNPESGGQTSMFVVHEFILGKGVHCKEVYNDLAHSQPVKSGFNKMFPDKMDTSLSAFPILFCLKKTCCDLFQNILKCSAHIKNGDNYEILGFFKRVSPEKLKLFTNKDTAHTIIVETDIKDLIKSRSLVEPGFDIKMPDILECTNTDKKQVYFELYDIAGVSGEVSPSIPLLQQPEDYISIVEKLNSTEIGMANIRWALVNNSINIKTIESLFLSCLYARDLKHILPILNSKKIGLPVNTSEPLLTIDYLIRLFESFDNTFKGDTDIDPEEIGNINYCIYELQNSESKNIFTENRLIEPYKSVFSQLYTFVTHSQYITSSDLEDIETGIQSFNTHFNNELGKGITGVNGCIGRNVSLFTYNNMLWEFFRPSGNKNMIRNINTISDYGNKPYQIAITGDILDSFFATMLVSLSVNTSLPETTWPNAQNVIDMGIGAGESKEIPPDMTFGGRMLSKTKKNLQKRRFITKKRRCNQKNIKITKKKMKSKSSKNKHYKSNRR